MNNVPQIKIKGEREIFSENCCNQCLPIINAPQQAMMAEAKESFIIDE